MRCERWEEVIRSPCLLPSVTDWQHPADYPWVQGLSWISPALLSPSDWPAECHEGLWVAVVIMTPSPANTTPPSPGSTHVMDYRLQSQELGLSETVGDKHWDYWVTLMTIIIGLRDIKDDISPWHVPTHGTCRITCHSASMVSCVLIDMFCGDPMVPHQCLMRWYHVTVTLISQDCGLYWVTILSLALTIGHMIRPLSSVMG